MNAREARHQSTTNEWFTPAPIIAAAREVMGGIDMDPASCAEANKIVQATHYHTIETNGLAHDWYGRVWLNPPYGRDAHHKSNQAIWTEYLLTQYEVGNTEEAILLVNAETGSRWFAPLWRFPICFVARRLRFLDEQGNVQSGPTHANVLVYLGSSAYTFARVFRRFGPVIIDGMADERSRTDVACADRVTRTWGDT